MNRLHLTQGSVVHSSVKIAGAKIVGLVEIGEGSRLAGPGVKVRAASKVTIGRFSTINGPNTDIVSLINPVTIGSFCSIARNVSIQEFNHRYDRLSTYHMHHNIFKETRTSDLYSNGPVEIGNDVWVGTQCVITSGAKIGNGAVVAANSVVIGEVPPFAIVAGSPARVLKFRFDEARIKEIEAMQWWDWPIEKIKQHKQLFE